jgi:uncharacterized protein
MFNMGDKSFEQRDPVMKLRTIEQSALFLKQGCMDLGVEDLSIGFHGGEPMMQKKKDFAMSCEIFKATLGDKVNLQFTMQTNAMLIDDEWISLFNKYRVCLGISIDGPKEYHDRDRIDHYGKGTYDRVVSKISYLQKSDYFKNKTTGPGLLCVINPGHSAKKIYRHFVDDLGARFMDFLLPYNTHLHQLEYPPEAYGKYLCDLFDEWTADDNPKVQVRRLSSILGLFHGGTPEVYAVGQVSEDELPLISISSVGDLSPSDEFRATDPSINYSGETIFNTSLKKYLNNPIFLDIQQATVNLPAICKECCWKNICSGGTVVNRYHKANQFDNPSIYCSGLKDFYATIVSYLLKNSYDYDRLASILNLRTDERAVA